MPAATRDAAGNRGLGARGPAIAYNTAHPVPADVNGDGTSDLLLQSGGTVKAGILVGGMRQGGTVISNGAGGAVVRATGDFNGDGTTDLVLAVNLPAGTTVAGVGDFDDDGAGDILLQNGGTVVAWL